MDNNHHAFIFIFYFSSSNYISSDYRYWDPCSYLRKRNNEKKIPCSKGSCEGCDNKSLSHLAGDKNKLYKIDDEHNFDVKN